MKKRILTLGVMVAMVAAMVMPMAVFAVVGSDTTSVTATLVEIVYTVDAPTTAALGMCLSINKLTECYHCA